MSSGTFTAVFRKDTRSIVVSLYHNPSLSYEKKRNLRKIDRLVIISRLDLNFTFNDVVQERPVV